MLGDGKHRVKFGFRQSRQKPGPEPVGKPDALVPGREFAGTIHTILSSEELLALPFKDRFGFSLVIISGSRSGGRRRPHSPIGVLTVSGARKVTLNEIAIRADWPV